MGSGLRGSMCWSRATMGTECQELELCLAAAQRSTHEPSARIAGTRAYALDQYDCSNWRSAAKEGEVRVSAARALHPWLDTSAPSDSSQRHQRPFARVVHSRTERDSRTEAIQLRCLWADSQEREIQNVYCQGFFG